MTAVERLAHIVGAPDLILPWLDRFYDEDDARLVFRVATGAPMAHGAELDRAVRRAVLDRDEAGAYAPASFHDRLEIWALFEGWKDVPSAIHRRLAEWEIDDYTESVRPTLEALRDGRPVESDVTDYAYLLLDEAEAVIAAEPHVYLWPCDCRAIVGRCRKPLNVCLRFDNDRGLGWEISKEHAVEVLRAADRAGLMHTDYVGRSVGDMHAICNCCTDCCFPHLAAERLGATEVWPRRRHVARIEDERCTACGRCARRCPFGAITLTTDERPQLEPASCRGCGLCSTTCPEGAVEMLPLGPAPGAGRGARAGPRPAG
jgi:ferredoxin